MDEHDADDGGDPQVAGVGELPGAVDELVGRVVGREVRRRVEGAVDGGVEGLAGSAGSVGSVAAGTSPSRMTHDPWFLANAPVSPDSSPTVHSAQLRPITAP